MKKQKKIILFAFITLLLLLGYRQVSAQETLNPEPSPSEALQPTFFCLGPCPTLQPSPTVAELLPDEPSPNGLDPVTPTITISPTPDILQPDPNPGKHKPDKDRGLIRRLLRIIEKLLGNQPQPTPIEPTPAITEIPTATLTPTIEASPSATVEPTEEPTPEPTEPPQQNPPGNILEQILELFRQLFDFLRQLFGFPPDNRNPRWGPRDPDRRGGGDRQRPPRQQPSPQDPGNPGDPGDPGQPQPTVPQNPGQPGQPSAAPSTTQPSTAPSNATGDTQAPTAPTNLRAASSGNTTINLTWSAATDNVGVAYYIVYRSEGDSSTGGNSGITWNSGQVRGTSFSNTGLTAGKAYYYYVRAFDAANNKGPNSNTAGVTLGGATKPNSLKVTVGLSGKSSLKDIKIPIQVDGPNGFSKTSTQGNTVNKTDSYTFTGLANGKYTLHISYGTYKSVTTTITFDNSSGGETISKSYTLAK